MLAGRANFILYSEKSTTKKNYLIKRDEEHKVFRVIHLQETIGYIVGEAFYLTGEIRTKGTSNQVIEGAKAFKWYWNKLVNNQPIDSRFYACHIGKCGKCSRVLTDEDSIRRGIGPECWKKIHQGSQAHS